MTRLFYVDWSQSLQPTGPPTAPYLYGAAEVAAAYCGLGAVPKAPRGTWEHGWAPAQFAHLKMDPTGLIGYDAIDAKKHFHWVARRDEEEYLKANGYRHARAIGLPIVYLPERSIPRRKGSLLVMPGHSLDYTQHEWRCDEYADEIARIRSSFSDVVVCVHPSCWRKGYWVKAFRNRGFVVIQALEGGFVEGRNAYERIQTLLSSFEFMTTNAFGSQVVYAALFGAKVSFYGTFAEYRAEDYANTPFYVRNPRMLPLLLSLISEAGVRGQYGHLFTHPADAIERPDWGRQECGYENRVSPHELRQLLGWTRAELARTAARAAVPEVIKHVYRLGSRPAYRTQHREWKRLSRLPAQATGTSMLLGRPFRFGQAARFRRDYEAVIAFRRLSFDTAEPTPLFVLCGAGDGLELLFLNRRFPHARILAFEPSPEAFERLRSNCAEFGLKNVELRADAVSGAGGPQPLLLGPRPRIAQSNDFGASMPVQSVRLRDLLRDCVSLLFLRTPGMEEALLADCQDQLATVERLVVEHTHVPSAPQVTSRVIALLESAGFLVQICSTRGSSAPFLEDRFGLQQALLLFAARL